MLCYGMGEMNAKKIIFNKIDPNFFSDIVIIVVANV